MASYEAVVEKLASLGSKVSEFNQSTEAKGAGVAKGQVDEGFCRGVSLDWIRRVLQGGKHKYTVSAKPERTLRMATIQLNYLQFMNASNTEALAHLNDLKRDIADSLAAYNKARESHSAIVTLFNENLKANQITLPPSLTEFVKQKVDFDPKLTGPTISTDVLGSALGIIFHSLKAQLDKHNDLVEKYNKAQEVLNSASANWKKLAQGMDGYFNDTRKEKRGPNPDNLTRKPFSNVKLEASSERKKYDSIVQAAAVAFGPVGSGARLVPGKALLLGFGLEVTTKCNCPGGGSEVEESGHAVAIHATGGSPGFVLFDPNYGMFAYTKEQAVQALDCLFNRHTGFYNDDKGKGKCKKWGQEHPQTVQITGGMSYDLFTAEVAVERKPLPEAPKATPPAAVAQQKVVPPPVTMPKPSSRTSVTGSPRPSPAPSSPGGGSFASAKNFWQNQGKK